VVDAPLLPRFRSIFIKRWWGVDKKDQAVIAKFPVGTLLRPGGWMVIGCRPSEVKACIDLLSGWGLDFGTLAFRRHTPYKPSHAAWRNVKNWILREDLQEVLVIGFKGPMSNFLHRKFASRTRPFLTNLPTRWEYNAYWKFSQFWGYPRLEIWARPYEGTYPQKWTRIGPHLDGMPIGQSLWLEHAKRFSTHLDTSWLDSPGG
jgi:hypothetical protein